MKTVLYSDILGMSKYVSEDIRGVIELHEMFQENIWSTYDSDLLQAIDILPMSDSIFLTSDDVNTLTKHWCRLLLSFIISTSDRSTHPSSERDPRTVETKIISINACGESVRTVASQKQYPLYLRSGISVGDYKILGTKGLWNKEVIEHLNIAGPGVVKAVHLGEIKLKGAFFLTNQETFELFDEDLKGRCVHPDYQDDIIEILWPAFYFKDECINDTGSLKRSFVTYRNELILPAYDLYKYFYDDDKIIEQYKAMLLLFKKSFLAYCDYRNKIDAMNINGKQLFYEWLKGYPDLVEFFCVIDPADRAYCESETDAVC